MNLKITSLENLNILNLNLNLSKLINDIHLQRGSLKDHYSIIKQMFRNSVDAKQFLESNPPDIVLSRTARRDLVKLVASFIVTKYKERNFGRLECDTISKQIVQIYTNENRKSF